MGKMIKYQEITATRVTDKVLKLQFSDNKESIVSKLTQPNIYYPIKAVMGNQRQVKFLGFISEDNELFLAKELQ